MKTPCKHQRDSGFSLIELLIVITIIIILAGLTMGGLQFVKNKQRYDTARIQIELLGRGIEEYRQDHGDYPGEINAGGANGTGQTNMLYQALYYEGYMAEDGGSDSIYLSDLDPDNNNQKWIEGKGSSATIIDPWKQEYRYRRGENALNPDYDIWSSGKDLQTNGDKTSKIDKDDISNY